jgi:hypothetical protein
MRPSIFLTITIAVIAILNSVTATPPGQVAQQASNKQASSSHQIENPRSSKKRKHSDQLGRQNALKPGEFARNEANSKRGRDIATEAKKRFEESKHVLHSKNSIAKTYVVPGVRKLKLLRNDNQAMKAAKKLTKQEDRMLKNPNKLLAYCKFQGDDAHRIPFDHRPFRPNVNCNEVMKNMVHNKIIF